MTPIEVLFGCQFCHMADAMILSGFMKENIEIIDLPDFRKKIKMHISQDQKAQKERYDKKRAEATKYAEGQLVMVARAVPSTGCS